MRRFRDLAVLTTLVVAVLVPVARAEVLRLRSGGWLQGEIVQHTENEIVFRRWDNGGTITLPWDAILAEDALRIQKALGYVTAEDLEETIRGAQVLTQDGKVHEGLLVETTPEVLRLKTAFRVVEVPIATVKKTAEGGLYLEVDLPLTAVYSRKELYEQRLADLAAQNKGRPASVQAENHYRFSEWLLQFGYLAEARTHLLLAAELDPEYGTRFRSKLASIEKRIEEGEVESAFGAARSLAKSHDFTKAFAALDAIEAKYPPEKLTRDLTEERDWIQAEMDRYLTAEIPDRFFVDLRNLATAASRDRDADFDELVEYASKEMGDEAMRKTATFFGIEEKDAQSYFAKRASRSPRIASFGGSTFIVGTGIKEGEKGAPVQADSGNGGGGGQGQEPEEAVDPIDVWWRAASGTTRSGFFYAYYCLQNFTVVKSTYDACSNCGGKGIIMRVNAGIGGGATSATLCPRCQGYRYDRTIYFE
ncbi:MAG: hypothetical protein HY720_29995 [Planctomycetes bacterium]|nr:hypothetical protein [Planctomycetota bacterium]